MKLVNAWFFFLLIAGVSIAPAIAQEGEVHGRFLGAKETVYPDWFKTSFLDFSEDVAEAAEEGRRVMMIFHQDNCPYCNALVEQNLAQKDIEETLKQQFDVIAINMWGDREVATVDGKALTEKSFASLLRVQFTPTILVLNDKGGLALRLNGYVPPNEFKLALQYASSHDSPKNYRAFLEQNSKPSSNGRLVASDLFAGESLVLPPKEGKPVAVFFEQRDCPACEKLHNTVLKDPETRALLTRFDSYQLDMWGDQPVTIGGKATSARALANDLSVKYAPTIVLFGADGKEVIRAEALFKSFHTQSMLDYVVGEHYESEPSFQRYLSERAEAIQATGKDVDIWK